MAHRKIHSCTVGSICVNVYRDSEWGEFVCKPSINGKVQPELTWYFIQYRDNAIIAARNIAYQMAQNQKQ